MIPDLEEWLKMLLAFVVSLVIAYLMTPPVKDFAGRVGAIDVPKDERRVHDHPIPRMGGIAIFLGFVISLLLFVNMSTQVMGLLVGAVIIAVMGAVDDIVNLSPMVKLAFQLLAAIVAVRSGLVFDVISNPNVFAEETTIEIGFLSVHQRNEPDRRAGWPGCGRGGNQLHLYADRLPAGGRAGGFGHSGSPYRRLPGLHAL